MVQPTDVHPCGKLPNIPSLAESIRREGVLTAITVDRRDDGDFDLVAGFRRVAASRLAGLTSIPAVIRDRTGEGQFVDVSAVECISSLVGDRLFEYSVTGEIPGPEGSRNTDMAPHACYPCGNEEWISIAVASEDEWRRLCEPPT